MRFEELYERRLGGRLTVLEAADILGVSERTFCRVGCRVGCRTVICDNQVMRT